MKNWDVMDWALWAWTVGLMVILPALAIICYTMYRIFELFT